MSSRSGFGGDLSGVSGTFKTIQEDLKLPWERASWEFKGLHELPGARRIQWILEAFQDVSIGF